ncbi:hypothetical protein JL722_2722 [Aureococcus anophagefferens]|nr:hypothetical protein JL722_2722 [Aureococcus anophagefferens]
MGRKHHHHHGAEAKPSGHHRKHAPSNNSAAANYIQAVVRAYVLRKSQHRDLLRARLEAYAVDARDDKGDSTSLQRRPPRLRRSRPSPRTAAPAAPASTAATAARRRRRARAGGRRRGAAGRRSSGGAAAQRRAAGAARRRPRRRGRGGADAAAPRGAARRDDAAGDAGRASPAPGVDVRAAYWGGLEGGRELKWLFWSRVAQTAEHMHLSQVCSHASFVGELLSNDGIRELLVRYDDVLATAFAHFSGGKARLGFREFLHMLSVLGLHPKIPNDAKKRRGGRAAAVAVAGSDLGRVFLVSADVRTSERSSLGTLLDVEGDGGLANARARGSSTRSRASAAAPASPLTRRQRPGPATPRGAPAAADGGGGAWAAPGLAARGLESVRKALHDQLYVVFRIYCALGTVAQQSAKKLCLETFFLFVNDISLYAALGYRDFAATGAGVARADVGAQREAWIVEAKLRRSPTDEMTLFQFLLLNEECVAEDYALLEEHAAAERYARPETSESGLCEHCMAVAARSASRTSTTSSPGARAASRQTVRTDTESDDGAASDREASRSSSSDDDGAGDAAAARAARPASGPARRGGGGHATRLRDALFSYAHAADALVVFKARPRKWRRGLEARSAPAGSSRAASGRAASASRSRAPSARRAADAPDEPAAPPPARRAAERRPAGALRRRQRRRGGGGAAAPPGAAAAAAAAGAPAGAAAAPGHADALGHLRGRGARGGGRLDQAAIRAGKG